MPSVRSLADEVGVSPGTVALAYRMLRERGMIRTAHGKRAQVSARPPVPRTHLSIQLPPGVRDLTSMEPDPELLPDVGAELMRDLYRPTLYRGLNVAAELRAEMTADFARDGIGGELTVTNGALDFLERLLAARLRPGEVVLVEDPMWTSTLSLLRTIGMNAVGVAADDEGMLPDALRDALAHRHASALLVTPRAQNPSGSALSAERAARLREVLALYPELLVVEDDHASLIAGTPCHTLTTGREHWAVVRSMGKALGPDLRVAVAASDRGSADAVQGRQLIGPGWVSHFVQRIVAALLASPDVQRQVAHAASIYAQRRDALVAELARHGVDAHGRSGFTVMVPVPDESAVVTNLALRGWGVRPGEGFRLNTGPFIRVCTATLAPAEAAEFATALAELLHTRTVHRE